MNKEINKSLFYIGNTTQYLLSKLMATYLFLLRVKHMYNGKKPTITDRVVWNNVPQKGMGYS